MRLYYKTWFYLGEKPVQSVVSRHGYRVACSTFLQFNFSWNGHHFNKKGFDIFIHMIRSLDAYELSLVTQPQILLTKNKIIQKVCGLFGELYEVYKNVLHEGKLSIENEVAGKISRGENYQGLPYVMLDYPRQFGKVDVLAIRTFFWWGNFFSITLQLGGEYQNRYAPQIEKAIDKNGFAGWSVSIGEDRWQHHFEERNYTGIEQGKNYNLTQLPYVKVAKKIPLEKWDDAELFFFENFRFLMNILGS